MAKKPTKKSPPAKKAAKKASSGSAAKKSVGPKPIQKPAAKTKPAPAPKPVKKRAPTPLKQIGILAPERSRMNSKLSRLRKQAEQYRGQRGVGFIREQIKYLTEDRDAITKKITRLRKKETKLVEVRDEKSKIKGRMRRIDNKLNKMLSDGQYESKEAKKLNTEYMRLAEEVHEMNEELGIEDRPAKFTEEQVERQVEELSEKLEEEGEGWEAHPATPHTIWDAMKHLDEALNKGEFELYIIDGKKFQGNDFAGIRFAASNFWRTMRSVIAGTPLIQITLNMELNGVQYEPFDTARA